MAEPKKVPELNALFLRQQGIDDRAIPSDPAVAFDAGPALLAMNATDFRRFDQEVRRESGRDLDMLGVVASMIGDHKGPYEVQVEKEEYLAWLEAVGFDPSDVVQVKDSTLEGLRARYGVEAYVSSPLRLLADTQIVDWRVGEGEDGALSGKQKQPWPVRLYQMGNALSMEFDTPDGTKRLLNIELDQGNLKLMPHRGEDVDLDAIVLVETDRVLISHYQGGSAVAFDENGVHQVAYEPKPSLGENDDAPKP